ncbi:MAG: hypothetical protein K2X55_16605 [Burkholderiaceae bacterium]|nr:hypothetical protein [Burkholderiaceae bacterium]
MKKFILISLLIGFSLIAFREFFSQKINNRIEYDLILSSAIKGDAVSIYRIGERQKELKDKYAWFIVCKEYITSSPKPHSVEINKTEFEIDTAIIFFKENLSAQEKEYAEKQAKKIKESISKIK